MPKIQFPVQTLLNKQRIKLSEHRHHSAAKLTRDKMIQWWNDERLNQRANGSFLSRSHSFANSYGDSINQHNFTPVKRKRDERQCKATGKDGERRERERGRKQSQRHCDTQGFLVSFWNLMNQTVSTHTHAHTHASPTLPIKTAWVDSCRDGLKEKAAVIQQLYSLFLWTLTSL